MASSSWVHYWSRKDRAKDDERGERRPTQIKTLVMDSDFPVKRSK